MIQRKQALAIARRQDRMTNLAPRQRPPMVTPVQVSEGEGDRAKHSIGILVHPPTHVQMYHALHASADGNQHGSCSPCLWWGLSFWRERRDDENAATCGWREVCSTHRLSTSESSRS